MRFSESRKNLRRDFSGFPAVEIAILGDTPTQFLHQSNEGLAYDLSVNPVIYEADFDQIERKMVKQAIPRITVPDLQEDPAECLEYPYRLILYETSSVSDTDESRIQPYQEEAEGMDLQKSYTPELEFLASFDIISLVSAFDAFHTPRFAQLSQRSNHFNLRAVRYTEHDIDRIAGNPDYLTRYFTPEDRFGDYNLISPVVLKKQTDSRLIETWLMSFRVLKRGVETFVLNHLMRLARENGFLQVVGKYLRTEKNSLIQDHYRTLGFVPQDHLWVMDTAS